jgi:hypothetical protein
VAIYRIKNKYKSLGIGCPWKNNIYSVGGEIFIFMGERR